MGITELTLCISFLFLPGIICCLIIESLTELKHDLSYRFVIQTFVLGCISYSLLALIYYLLNVVFGTNFSVVFISNIMSNKLIIDFKELLFVIICSIVLAFIFARANTKTYLHRFAKFIRVSSSDGYNDLWHYLMSLDNIEWILVRDKSKDLMYEGWIGRYSFSHIDGELFLRDVKVYNDTTGVEYYELNGIYLNYNKDTMVIEIRQFSERKEKNAKRLQRNPVT